MSLNGGVSRDSSIPFRTTIHRPTRPVDVAKHAARAAADALRDRPGAVLRRNRPLVVDALNLGGLTTYRSPCNIGTRILGFAAVNLRHRHGRRFASSALAPYSSTV